MYGTTACGREFEITAAIGFLFRRAYRRGIDMPLHDMAVETAVHQHGALEVHEVAGHELPYIGAVESFLYRRHGIAIVGLKSK